MNPGSVLRFVRDGWLILGATLVLLLGLEACYRAQGEIRRALFYDGTPSVPHPLAGEDWYAGYLEELRESGELDWHSYVYFRRAPFQGEYINVDERGRRKTVQTLDRDADDRQLVVLLGGSTMWGTFQRDGETIPSELAARFAARPTGSGEVEFLNLGETGYVLTQELVALNLLLREGLRPSAVVFYDGINDVVSLLQSGVPGRPQNERNRAREFELGRDLFHGHQRFGDGARAMGALTQGILAQSQLAMRILEMAPSRGGGGAAEDLGRLVEAYAESYRETAALGVALAERFGFEAIFVWQPTLWNGRKPLSGFERMISEGVEGEAFYERMAEVHRRLPERLARELQDLDGALFIEGSGLFENHSETVYLDIVGHTTPTAVPVVVDAIEPALRGVLERDGGSTGAAPVGATD